MCTLYRLLLLRKCAFNQLPPIIWSEQLLRHKFVTNRLSLLSSLCFLSSWNNARKRGRKTQKKKYCSDFSFQGREAVTLAVRKPRKYPSKWPSTIVGTCNVKSAPLQGAHPWPFWARLWTSALQAEAVARTQAPTEKVPQITSRDLKVTSYI